jgi:hypothetical protein
MHQTTSFRLWNTLNAIPTCFIIKLGPIRPDDLNDDRLNTVAQVRLPVRANFSSPTFCQTKTGMRKLGRG